MPKLKDAAEKSEPTTAELSTSSQSTPSLNNIKNEEEKANSSSIQGTTADQVQKQLADLNNVSKLLQGLNVNSPPVNRQTKQEQSTTKGKNARKKKNKQLHLNTNLNSNNVQHQLPVYGSPNTSSVHNFFSTPVSSPYQGSGARFLENMKHHPHFQYMQSLQAIEMQQTRQATSIPIPRSPQVNAHAQSMPNTPLIHLQQRPGQISIPCSPLTNPQVNMHYMQNMFFQNIMQHPLLSQTLFNNVQPVVNQPSVAAKTKNESSKKKKSHEVKKFPKYLSIQDVEDGLKNKTLIEGIIRINPKQFQHAYISSEDRDEQDVFIDGLCNRNRALEGDVVVVQLVDSDSEESPDNETDESKKDSKKKDNSRKRNKKKVGTTPDNKNNNSSKHDEKEDDPKPMDQKEDNAKQGDSKSDSPIQNDGIPGELKEANATQDTSKQDGPKQNDPKPDDSKKVDLKPDGSKQDDTKPDRPKQNDPKPDDSKKVDLKPDGSKQDDKKPDGPKQNDPKAEGSKKDDQKNKQRKGKVVYIKEKVHNRTCIGNLKLMPDLNRQRALFVPRDHRIPRLNIPFTCWPDNFYDDAKKYENTLFLAKIVDWSDTRFAIGQILSNIGQSGNMICETMAILAQNDLDVTPFGPEVRDLFPRLDYTIPEEEIAKREDCRKMCIFSIDPNNCRDIDDAVSCRKLDNGNYEVGVHISDVAHYLTENTILDEKVAEKATTIYLVEKAYHMLPDELCMLCSLFPGVDKLAFSVFWEITKDAKVLSSRFAKTVINSCCQLAYEHAQAILDDSDDAEKIFPETYNGFTFSDIKETIKIIGGMAATFRKNRFDSGALRIDQVKVAFHLSPSDGLPESFCIYENQASHQMIEEFMLLANMTVAQRIYEDHPQLAFLRCHPPPSGFMMKQLVKSLQPMGIELDIASAGHLHRSLIPYVGPDNNDPGRAMVLNMLCAKPMARAKYFCAASCEDEDFHHYALNVPLYTHFTSPIRRYADIMVHRLLAASLKYRETPRWEIDYVRMVAAQCNKQKYNSKKASEMSSELYMLKYIEMHSPVITEAVVVDVREKYIDVIVIAMGLNRRIFFNNDFPGEFNCIKHEGSARMSKMEVKWREQDGKPEVQQVIEVFSILKVQLHKGDDMVKVETTLIRPQ